MAYRINASDCTGCGSCEFDCPNTAVKMKGDIYVIDAGRCTECEGFFATPQCVAACPNDAVVHA